MPMERHRYPRHWERLAFGVKALADWRCEQCDRPCRTPGEPLHEFICRIQGDSGGGLDWVNQTAVAEICHHPARFVLTTAHLDQNPANNRASNLRALCAGCHLRHDAAFKRFNAAQKRERMGQLNLLEMG